MMMLTDGQIFRLCGHLKKMDMLKSGSWWPHSTHELPISVQRYSITQANQWHRAFIGKLKKRKVGTLLELLEGIAEYKSNKNSKQHSVFPVVGTLHSISTANSVFFLKSAKRFAHILIHNFLAMSFCTHFSLYLL